MSIAGPSVHVRGTASFCTRFRSTPDDELYPVWNNDDAPAGGSIGVSAVPYFRWGNRTAGGMRVWLPTN